MRVSLTSTFTICLLSLLPTGLFGQTLQLSLRSDTAISQYPQQKLEWLGQEFFYFEPGQEQAEFDLTAQWTDMPNLLAATLLPSPDFQVTDTLRVLQSGKVVGKITFNKLKQNHRPRLIFNLLNEDSTLVNRSVVMYAFFKPQGIPKEPFAVETFLDQEKEIVLPLTHVEEVSLPNQWIEENGIRYRLFKDQGLLKIKLQALRKGQWTATIPLGARRPFLNSQGFMTQEFTPLRIALKVLPSPMAFLNVDQSDIFYEPMGAGSTLIKLTQARGLQVGKTYRVESQEQPGGRLIAEIYIRSQIQNESKVLAMIRTYALHREEEGYLYLKTGDRTRFFTNFNILVPPTLQKVSILRPGQDWTTGLSIKPGEEVEVKLEGLGLGKASFSFADNLYNAIEDTSRISEVARYYSLKVPLDIKENRIRLTMNGKPTAFDLLIREYQRPHDFNFVTVNYGTGPQLVSANRFDVPATYEGEIRDIIIGFRPDKLDEDGNLYGIQYINMKIRVTDPNKRLLELREINHIKVVPNATSPRFAAYDHSKSTEGVIRINDYLSNTTHDREPWTQIEITFSHDKNRYGGQGLERKITIIPIQQYALNLEVSFPAGLLAKRFNQPGIGRFTGISTAALIQASFYKPGKINKLSPWKVGGGFLALNALSSLTDNEDDKDLGVLAIVSFYPIGSNSRVKFPLHAGIGYLFKNNTMFMVVGPGIQVNF